MILSYDDAVGKMVGCVKSLGVECVRIEEACGRVLRMEVRADRDFPVYDRVMMDGYGLRGEEFRMGRLFRVVGSAVAGREQAVLPDEVGVCVEVMTGAPLPVGVDCVVPVEFCEVKEDGRVWVKDGFEHEAGRFIHRAGSDAKMGDVLLREGMVLGGREVGVLASCGVGWVEVSCVPRVVVMATGDELVGVDEMPEGYQIRQSNGYALVASLKRAGYDVVFGGVLKDDAVAGDLEDWLEGCDWLVMTGAVSKGVRDFVPGLLGELGCRKVFHGVAQRPGKPAGFWVGPSGQAVMALPGNPVSALVGLHAFVFRGLAAACGRADGRRQMVEVRDGVKGLEGMTMHLPVRFCEDGKVEAVATGNSGDFIGLLRSDGYVTVPPRGHDECLFPMTIWE